MKGKKDLELMREFESPASVKEVKRVGDCLSKMVAKRTAGMRNVQNRIDMIHKSSRSVFSQSFLKQNPLFRR